MMCTTINKVTDKLQIADSSNTYYKRKKKKDRRKHFKTIH